MSIKDVLGSVKPRENVGQMTFRAYEFQIYFAISLLLDKESNNESYCLLMDYCDDVVIMDNKDDPQIITFYQVKTNNNEKISLSTIVTKKFLEKMCYNLENFADENSKAVFVTNGNIPINMKNKTSTIYVKDFNDFVFSDLSPLSLSQVFDSSDKKAEAIKKLQLVSNYNFNPDNIYLLKTDFSFDGFEENILGKLTDFLIKSNLNFDVVAIKSLKEEIYNRLNNLQKCKHTPLVIDYHDIIKNKAFTNEEFMRLKDNIQEQMVPYDINVILAFAKDRLSYVFNNRNYMEIKSLYDEFTIDSIKNKDIYSYIINKMKEFDYTGIPDNLLFYKIYENLLTDTIISKSEFFNVYYEFIIIVFIYKR